MANMDLWMQDVMSQKFLISDITRLILIDGLCADGIFKRITPKTLIYEYVYRVYSDYDIAAKSNPDIRIKNIKYYGIRDIK